MKINRFIALAAIALLVVGAMGAISLKAFAKGAAAPAAQVSIQTADCSQDQADGTEVKSATDTDNIELQCGDQVEDGLPDSAAAPAQGSSSTSAIPAAASLVNAQAAPLTSVANTTVSSTTTQDNQQIEDDLPDSAETIGTADIDNVQLEEQVGDQNAQDNGVEAPEVEAPAVP